ncbi:MAG: hypothetical protein JWQ66_2936 [Mucilaginibacter sp.]|nr:hypothetical protein [Mucilaginibacter sp.]
MSTTLMPKTYKEQLDDLEIGDNILISLDNRQTWANHIWAAHRDTNKQFTIRTNRQEPKETRVWRLPDLEPQEA